jgi:hypothetical protein
MGREPSIGSTDLSVWALSKSPLGLEIKTHPSLARKACHSQCLCSSQTIWNGNEEILLTSGS